MFFSYCLCNYIAVVFPMSASYDTNKSVYLCHFCLIKNEELFLDPDLLIFSLFHCDELMKVIMVTCSGKEKTTVFEGFRLLPLLDCLLLYTFYFLVIGTTVLILPPLCLYVCLVLAHDRFQSPL